MIDIVFSVKTSLLSLNVALSPSKMSFEQTLALMATILTEFVGFEMNDLHGMVVAGGVVLGTATAFKLVRWMAQNL